MGSSNPSASLQTLPYDISTIIFCYLPSPGDVCNLALTCNSLAQALRQRSTAIYTRVMQTYTKPIWPHCTKLWSPEDQREFAATNLITTRHAASLNWKLREISLVFRNATTLMRLCSGRTNSLRAAGSMHGLLTTPDALSPDDGRSLVDNHVEVAALGLQQVRLHPLVREIGWQRRLRAAYNLLWQCRTLEDRHQGPEDAFVGARPWREQVMSELDPEYVPPDCYGHMAPREMLDMRLLVKSDARGWVPVPEGLDAAGYKEVKKGWSPLRRRFERAVEARHEGRNWEWKSPTARSLLVIDVRSNSRKKYMYI